MELFSAEKASANSFNADFNSVSAVSSIISFSSIDLRKSALLVCINVKNSDSNLPSLADTVVASEFLPGVVHVEAVFG